MLRAKLIAGVPADLVGSLTGLTEGRFPVAARASYADDIAEAALEARQAGNAANVVESTDRARHRHLRQARRAGGRRQRRRRSRRSAARRRSAATSCLQDVYGNRYTYAHLGPVRRRYPVAASPSASRRASDASASSSCPDVEGPEARRRPPAPAAGQGARGRQAPSRRRAPSDDHGRGGQGAPVRAPGPPGRLRQRRRAAARSRSASRSPASRPSRPTSRGPRPRPRKDVLLKPLRPGCAGDRRHDARPHRQDRHGPRAARPLRDPPGRPRRPARSTRSRSSTAGSCSRPPRSTARRARTRASAPTPSNPSIGQIMLMSKELLEQRVLSDERIEHLRRAAARTSAPARSTAACSPRWSSSPSRACGPTVTALKCGHGYYTTRGQRVRALLRQRRRHRRDQRHPDPRPPGHGRDHRHHDPPPAHAAGHDEAPPDHQPHDVRGRRQHARRWPTTTTTSTSASSRCSAQARRASTTPCSSPASGSS